MQSHKSNKVLASNTAASRLHSREQESAVSSLPKKQTREGWFKRTTNRLSISTKISAGYAIAIGVTVVGTAVGFLIGDYYQYQATTKQEHASEEIRLLHQLQTSILQARSHQQQFIPLLTDPKLLQEEYTHFLHHVGEIDRVLAEVKTFEDAVTLADDLNTEEIQELLRVNHLLPDRYVSQINTLIKEIDPASLTPQTTEAARNRLLRFTNGSTALQLDAFSDNLVGVLQLAYREDTEATIALNAAESLRIKIIALSMTLSIAIATLLAISTSRAISRPIQTATQVARRVTRQSNFDLQVPVTTEDEIGVLATSLNQLIQRVKTLLEEQRAEATHQLVQSEKMSSLGRMIAGVAHEINNPINFIYGNLEHANDYTTDLLSLLKLYETEVINPSRAIQQQVEEVDLEFLRQDLPKLLHSMKVGSERVRQIVLSLKNFSRLDEGEMHLVDIHACIDSVLLILNSRIKKGIAIKRNYSDIPSVEGYAGGMYQVFMNILSNALDALDEQSDSQASKQIIVTTELLMDQVIVRIADSGPGISPENQAKIFETFFTTKPRGIGTGLGLSICHQIVVENHHGSLTCTSKPGCGTEFAIALPIKQASNPQPSAEEPALAKAPC